MKKTLWEQHVEYSNELEQMFKLKKLGYGMTRRYQMRNMQILEMFIKKNKSTKQIARKFKISEQAVREIITRLYNKRK